MHPCAGKHNSMPLACRSAEWEPELSLLCMNPACVFKNIGGLARSVVVSSGTLSPMNSFASELGVDFPVQLSTAHVVGVDNV